ncbi:MAG: dienelactone hydrolase family protein [Thermoflexales bacterium]|nr:dienelactone hydrolase family protein [Thermoflexales bacterium]
MRPLEILFLLPNLLRFGWWLLVANRRPRWLNWLPGLAALLMLAQVLIEGYRWQLVPAYGLTVLVLALTLLRQARPRPTSRRITTIALGVLGSLLLIIVALPPLLLPIPQDLPLTGPYRVGTLTVHWVDTSRTEIYSGRAGEPRELMVQIWYPAEPTATAQVAPWLDNVAVLGPALGARLSLPSFFLDHLKYVNTQAYLNAPVSPAAARYPVLLFSHGWGGFRAQNTHQAEQLASHGYIIAAIDHTYDAAATVFPDGRVALHNDAILTASTTPIELQAAAVRLVQQRAGDLAFVLDQLTQLNAADPAGRFTGRLDLSRVGVFGHSMGGGTTIEFCAHDVRCQAVLTMDAYLPPVSADVYVNGLRQPFLSMFSERWPTAENNRLFAQLFQSPGGSAYELRIAGTAHYDFSDIPSLTPLAPAMGLKGPLSADRVTRIIDDYSLAFFDQVFKSQLSPLLAAPSAAYPEVQFTAWP